MLSALITITNLLMVPTAERPVLNLVVWSAVLGAVIISVISAVLGTFVKDD